MHVPVAVELDLGSATICMSNDRTTVLSACTVPSMLPAPLIMAPASAWTEANSHWADLPHDLLVRIFASQPEPLHKLGAEFTCRAWAKAVSSPAGFLAKNHPQRRHVSSARMRLLMRLQGWCDTARQDSPPNI